MFDKLIENLANILRALTVPRALMLACLAVLFLALYITYDHQEVLVNGIKVRITSSAGNKVLVANPETSAFIKKVVDANPLITGVQLVSWNFQANTRDTVLFYSDQPRLQKAIEAAVFNRAVQAPPLFVAEEGTPEQREFARQNNERALRIYTSTFACYDTASTVLARDAPTIVEVAPTLCSLSVPPYVGKFAGYINLMLIRPPTGFELTELRLIAQALSNNIFEQQIGNRAQSTP